MKQNAPPWANTATRGSSSIASEGVITPTNSSAQESIEAQLQNGGLHCGAIWKSPRDRTRCIQATIREYHGNAYADFRLFELNASGQMLPVKGKGITVSVRQLGAFAKLAGDAYRKASQAGLTPRST